MTEAAPTPPPSPTPGDHLRAAVLPLRIAFGSAALGILAVAYAPAALRLGWLALAGTIWYLGVAASRGLLARAALLDRPALAPPQALASVAPTPTPPPSPAEPPPDDPLAEFREALVARDFGRARALAESIPDTPEKVAARHSEIEAARDAHIAALRARIEAAREAKDPSQVLDYHRELSEIAEPGSLHEEDRALVRWLVQQLQRRLQQGIVAAETAELAGRIAESFAGFPEGASMRAALPTLRRSAKLCARCGKPYDGIDDACPECLIGDISP